MVDQGDRADAVGVAYDGAQGDPRSGDRVQVRARRAARAQAGPTGGSRFSARSWSKKPRRGYAKRTRHPEFKNRMIWKMFQDERPSLMPLRAPFNGFVEKAVWTSVTCLVMADHNRYSVAARSARRMLLVLARRTSLGRSCFTPAPGAARCGPSFVAGWRR